MSTCHCSGSHKHDVKHTANVTNSNMQNFWHHFIHLDFLKQN